MDRTSGKRPAERVVKQADKPRKPRNRPMQRSLARRNIWKDQCSHTNAKQQQPTLRRFWKKPVTTTTMSFEHGMDDDPSGSSRTSMTSTSSSCCYEAILTTQEEHQQKQKHHEEDTEVPKGDVTHQHESPVRMDTSTIKSSCLKIATQRESLHQTFRKCAQTTNDTAVLVRFSHVDVHEHEVILGDNPSVSSGPPLTLGWKAVYSERCTIDQFHKAMCQTRGTMEDSSANKKVHENVDDDDPACDCYCGKCDSYSREGRRGKELQIGKVRRELLLKENGFSRDQMKLVEFEIARLKSSHSFHAQPNDFGPRRIWARQRGLPKSGTKKRGGLSLLLKFLTTVIVIVAVVSKGPTYCQASDSVEGRYSFSLSTFDRNGKLGQVHFANQAAAMGPPVVAVVKPNGILLAAPQVLPSPLMEDDGTSRFVRITENIVITHSGLSADGRVLMAAAQRMTIEHEYTFDESIPIELLLEELSLMYQEYTMKPAARPFGTTLLVAYVPSQSAMQRSGDRPMLYRIDPSGNVEGFDDFVLLNGRLEKTALPDAAKMLSSMEQIGTEEESDTETLVKALKDAIEQQKKKSGAPSSIEMGSPPSLSLSFDTTPAILSASLSTDGYFRKDRHA